MSPKQIERKASKNGLIPRSEISPMSSRVRDYLGPSLVAIDERVKGWAGAIQSTMEALGLDVTVNPDDFALRLGDTVWGKNSVAEMLDDQASVGRFINFVQVLEKMEPKRVDSILQAIQKMDGENGTATSKGIKGKVDELRARLSGKKRAITSQGMSRKDALQTLGLHESDMNNPVILAIFRVAGISAAVALAANVVRDDASRRIDETLITIKLRSGELENAGTRYDALKAERRGAIRRSEQIENGLDGKLKGVDLGTKSVDQISGHDIQQISDALRDSASAMEEDVRVTRELVRLGLTTEAYANALPAQRQVVEASLLQQAAATILGAKAIGLMTGLPRVISALIAEGMSIKLLAASTNLTGISRRLGTQAGEYMAQLEKTQSGQVIDAEFTEVK